MGNIVYPYPDFVPGTKIKSSEVDANFAAITDQVNGNITNENIAAGALIELSKLDLSDSATFTGDITFEGEVVMGGSSAFLDGITISDSGGVGTVTIDYVAGASTRTISIPNNALNAFIVLTEGTQTVNGVKIFTNIFIKSDHGVNTGLANLDYASTTDNIEVTIPDTAGVDADFVLTESDQLINGDKYFSDLRAPSIDPAEENQIHAGGLVKGWANISSAGAINDSQNVSSVTHGGVGQYDVFWNNDFNSVNYAVVVTANGGSYYGSATQSTNAASVTIVDNAGNPVDSEFSIIACGVLA